MAEQQPATAPALVAEPAPAPGGVAPPPATSAAPAAEKEDYLDKALDAGQKKFGAATGHNVDSAKMRSTNEKITDKLRGLFEKFTGKKVPSKISN